LFNLVAAANGWFAAHYHNVLYMSEPFRPHTLAVQHDVPHTILGLCTGPQGICDNSGDDFPRDWSASGIRDFHGVAGSGGEH
jgi:hypothetical protein